MTNTALETTQKADPWEPPCVIEDLPFEDYLKIPAASSHALKTVIDKSPKHQHEAEDRPTAAKDLGSVVHALVLEPSKADEMVWVEPDPGNLSKLTNAWKQMLVEFYQGKTGVIVEVEPKLALGKQLDVQLLEYTRVVGEMDVTVCTKKQYEVARRMRDGIFEKDQSAHNGAIFASGRAEVTMIGRDPFTDVLTKIRCDWLPDGMDVIVDLKTAASATYQDFAKAAGRYGYHTQAALYRMIYFTVMGGKRPSFLHAVVESEPPYDSAFWELDDLALQKGAEKMARALELWKLCETMEFWPGIGYDYKEGCYQIETLSLPKWAL